MVFKHKSNCKEGHTLRTYIKLHATHSKIIRNSSSKNNDNIFEHCKNGGQMGAHLDS